MYLKLLISTSLSCPVCFLWLFLSPPLMDHIVLLLCLFCNFWLYAGVWNLGWILDSSFMECWVWFRQAVNLLQISSVLSAVVKLQESRTALPWDSVALLAEKEPFSISAQCLAGERYWAPHVVSAHVPVPRSHSMPVSAESPSSHPQFRPMLIF